MKKMTPARIRLWPILGKMLLALLLLGVIVVWTSRPAQTVAQEPVLPPEATPDAEIGLQIFGERCANCHGSLGMGDGEMADRLPQPPAALGSQEFIRQAVPAEMFQTITNGIVASGMPPFGSESTDPLSVTDRWNAVAAIYSLGTGQGVVEEGRALYDENCLSCHSPEGGESVDPDLGDPAYWLNRSNQGVFDALSEAQIPEHEDLDLSEDERWSVVSYARTLTFDYADPMAAFEPIESAVISGTVTNGTTGEPLSSGEPVVLSAFTADFNPSLTMTTTLDDDGQYAFDLTMVPPDLVYLVTVEYEGISYGSEFGRIDRDQPALQLTVPVYERTTDASSVNIDQLHVILQFGEDQLQVSELYQFSQNELAVYVGRTGDPDEGTVHISLPEEATDVSFDRSFGGMESFFPAENVIQTNDGWADTAPLRPGSGTMSLLASYALPYDGNISFLHPVHYDVTNVNLVMPDVGVELAEEEQWLAREPQTMGEAGTFLNYSQPGVAAGESVAFTLEGEPQQMTIGSSGAVAVRDQTNELLIGGGVLLLAVAVGLYAVRLWRQSQPAPEVTAEATPAAVSQQTPAEEEDRRQELLQDIAELDDAFEAGQIEEEPYQRRRQALKDELMAIWEA